MRTLLSALVLAWATTLSAQDGPERILRFHADITVLADGTLDVTESIHVHALGHEIKRGIYRDLPTLYPRPGLSKGKLPLELWPWRAPFHFLSAKRDGKPEPWFSKSRGNGSRIYLGEKTVFLQTGQDYHYTLRYTMQRMVNTRLPEHHELYWNVTGNAWDFDIEECSATISLPKDPGMPLRLQAYTGRQGEQGADYAAQDLGSGRASFKATRVLRRAEGLTIVAGWPKGLLAEPGPLTRAGWALNDLREPFVALLALAAALALLLQRWWAYGQDPPQRPAVPRWEPPRGLPPAALRWLDGRGDDSTGFTATVLQLAVQGGLKIEKKKKGFTLTPVEGAEVEEQLGSAFLRLLQGHGPADSGSEREASFFRKALIAHSALLQARHKSSVALNLKQLWPGFVCLALGLGVSVLLGVGEPAPKLAFGGVILFLAAASGSLLAGARDAWRPGRIGIRWNLLLALGALGLVLGAAAIGCASALVGVFYGLWIALLGLVGGFLLGVFGVWMVQPSKDLQRLRDEIAGFTLYMGTAERHRLEYLHPPQDTPQLFEKLLPYAMALGVANTWSERFADVLEAASARGDYSPVWAVGFDRGHWGSSRGISSLGSSFASDLSGSISSASSPPSEGGSGFSGVGGGGGGSSGGGGGGGGGGGW